MTTKLLTHPHKKYNQSLTELEKQGLKNTKDIELIHKTIKEVIDYPDKGKNKKIGFE